MNAWRPDIKDPVGLAEDRDTGLCDSCGREDDLSLHDGKMMCNDCIADTHDLYEEDGYYD